MLYFSKIKLFSIYLIIFFLSLCSFVNFVDNKENFFLSKKVKEHKLMVAALKRGDEVITSGGVIGRVERILGDDKIDLLISENVTVQVIQSTIQNLLHKSETKK